MIADDAVSAVGSWLERSVQAFIAIEKAAQYLSACKGDPDISDVGRRLERWLAFDDDGVTLDQILQVTPPGAGKRTLRTVVALARRDEMVRQAVVVHFPNASQAQQARDFHRAWQRYSAGGWRRERALEHPAAHRDATVEADLWRIMKLRDHVLSERSIRGILAANYTYSLPTEAPKVCKFGRCKARSIE